MKKWISLLLVLCMVCMLFLSACGSSSSSADTDASEEEETTETEEVEEESEEESEEEEEVEEEAAEVEGTEEDEEAEEEAAVEEDSYFPLEETVTLTAWGTLIPPVLSITDDLNDFQVYSTAEEMTNVHLEWTSVSVLQSDTAFQLMVASGEYPDLIKGASNYMTGGTQAAVDQEVIIDLADYLDEYCPNYQAVRLSSEEYEKGSTTDSGVVGSFCYFASDVEALTAKGGFIRQDWLDELGLDVPVTVEDYHTVLTAFYNEYGATYGLPSEGMHFNSNFESAYDIAVPFDGGSMASGFYQIDGVVYYGPAQDGYRDYLQEMATWYSEGLISSDFLSDADSGSSGTVETELITTGKVGIFYGGATQYLNYADQANDEDFELTALAAPVLEEGQTTHTRGLSGAVSPALSISTSCSEENLELALRWCDWWYTEDGYMTANWGVEGYTFEYDENGDPVYTDIVTNNPDMDFDTSIVMYTMSEMGDHFLSDGRRIYQYYSEETLAIKELWSSGDDNAWVIPSDISMTTEETEELTEMSSVFYSYTSEWTLKFITGNASLEDDWDTYVETLISMGIEEAAELYEAAYARYLER